MDATLGHPIHGASISVVSMPSPRHPTGSFYRLGATYLVSGTVYTGYMTITILLMSPASSKSVTVATAAVRFRVPGPVIFMVTSAGLGSGVEWGSSTCGGDTSEVSY